MTYEELRAILHYDPDTGRFTWLPRPVTCKADKIFNTRFAGREAGCKAHPAGYYKLTRLDRLYYHHRLAWLYVTGRNPVDEIDHINGDTSDNRFCNLREATRAENCQNVRSRGRTCDLLGVHFDRARRMWSAQIGLNGETRYLGRYATAEEAHAAYLAAKREMHPFNPESNREVA